MEDKKATAKELKGLNYGEKVVRFINGHSRSFRFVGVMPSSENYLIFEDGEHLTYLHISSKDGTFNGDWYIMEYDVLFFDLLRKDYLQKQIDEINEYHNLS